MIKEVLVGILIITCTILVYLGSLKVKQRFPHPLTLPILTSSLFIIVFLLTFKVPYETYHIGGKWIEQLLGPAVVALALPLYKQRSLVKQFALPLFVGVFVGALVGMGTGWILTYLLGFDKSLILSMIPKSITTPVAIDIIDTIGGIPTLTAVFVIIAGTLGAAIHPFLFKKMNIQHYFARGVGMGCASHAIGTATSMENDEQEGVISTVAMTLSAINVSILASIFAWFL